MCVLTNRARDLITAENEWVSQSRNRVGSGIVFKRPQDLIFIFILQELKLLFLSI